MTQQTEEKALFPCPSTKASQRVVDWIIGLYQHGPVPSAQWPPNTVTNSWDKTFNPKDFPLKHKLLSHLPKQWEPEESSPVMLCGHGGAQSSRL